jgi:hypothetical protein
MHTIQWQGNAYDCQCIPYNGKEMVCIDNAYHFHFHFQFISYHTIPFQMHIIPYHSIYNAYHFHCHFQCIPLPMHTIPFPFPFPLPMHVVAYHTITIVIPMPMHVVPYHTISNAYHKMARKCIPFPMHTISLSMPTIQGNGRAVHTIPIHAISISNAYHCYCQCIPYNFQCQCIPYHTISNAYHTMARQCIPLYALYGMD